MAMPEETAKEELGIWTLVYAVSTGVLTLFLMWSQTVGYAAWEHYGSGAVHAIWLWSANLALVTFFGGSALLLVGAISLLRNSRKSADMLVIFGVLGDVITYFLLMVSDLAASLHGPGEFLSDGQVYQSPGTLTEHLHGFLTERLPIQGILAIAVIGFGIILVRKSDKL